MSFKPFKSIKKIAVTALAATLSFSASASSGQWSAGPIGILQASPYIGGEDGIMFVPAIAYQGEKLVIRGPFVDYYLSCGEREQPSFALTLGLGPNELEVDNDLRLAGIEDRDSGALFGARINYPFFKGTASFSVQTDITGKSDGQRAVLGWSRNIARAERGQWMVNAGVDVEYITSSYADYYFGISSDEALVSEFSAYDVGSVVQPSVNLNGYYNFTPQWQLIYNVEYQLLASDVKDSPIVDQSGVVSGLIGVVYNF